MTYSFLYGYYFGGDAQNSFSNFELIRIFVPFDLNTILFTYLIIGLSTTLISYSLHLIISKDILVIIGLLILSVVFHIILTGFFTNGFIIINILKFSVIWIFPLFISILILLFIRGVNNIYKLSSGALFGFTFYVFILLFLDNLNQNISESLVILCISIFSVIFTYIPLNNLTNILFVFPYTFLLFLLTVPQLQLTFFGNFHLNFKLISLVLVSVPISIFISWISKRFLSFDKTTETPALPKASNSLGETLLDIINQFLNPNTHKKATVFLLIFILAIFVLIPRVAASTAKVIREFTPNSELQFSKIQILTPSGTIETIDGIVVAERNNTLYISNKDWELEQVKTDQYYVNP